LPANDSWTELTRDAAGRFRGSGASAGSTHHGTSWRTPAAVAPVPSAQAQAKAVTYGVIGQLPAAQRSRYENQLASGGLQWLTGGLLAWHAAGHLDHATFRDRYLGGRGSDELVDHLRKAAAGTAATTAEELSAAINELAAAHRLMGANAWPSFLAVAHGHAQLVADSAAEGSAPPPIDGTAQTAAD
jgi:hypothetical protein